MKSNKRLGIFLATWCLITIPQTVMATEISESEAVAVEDTGQETLMNRIDTRDVMVIQVFQFADGSLDVWQTGSGFLTDGNTVVAPYAITAFSSSEDADYIRLAKLKKADYARVGVNLDDYDSIQDSFAVYVLPASGTFERCILQYSDPERGLAMYTTADSMGVEAVSFDQSFADIMVLAGFSTDKLTAASECLTGGSLTMERGGADVREITSGSIEDSQMTGNSMLDLGFTGGTLYDAEGNVCGMVLSVDETDAVLVNGLQIQNFIEVGPEDEGEDAVRSELLEKLELAVERAKNIDTTGYTEESVQTFASAIAEAESVLSDVNASGDAIEAAGENLNEAKSALKEKVVEEPAGSADKRLFIYCGISAGAAVLLCGIILLIVMGRTGRLLFDKVGQTGRARKKKKEGNKRRTREKEETHNPDGTGKDGQGYGGELARKVARSKNVDENGDLGTSVLSAGEGEETSVLNLPSFPAAYLLDEEGNRVAVTAKEFILGKEKKKVSYCIKGNPTVSRRHCMVKYKDGEFWVEDLESLNGTKVEGVEIRPHDPVRLFDGDTLTLSDMSFVFHTGEQD